MSAEKMVFNLKVNGRERSFKAYPMARLLDVLRQDLQLTAAKEGCGEGECGACSVEIDGVLVNSCLVPMIQVQGAEVLTAEGSKSEELLDCVQQAFVQCHGAQCGICTPGMVMASVNILRHCAQPSESEIREGLAGNLCRCTGYSAIVDSVAKAAKNRGATAKAGGEDHK